MPALVAAALRRNSRRDSASIGKSPVYIVINPMAPASTIGVEHAYQYLNISYPVPMQRLRAEPSNQTDPFKREELDGLQRVARVAIGVVLLGW